MAKLVLDNLTSLVSDNSAVTKLNNNFDAVEEAFDNTLSLDGTAPNSMQASLDMNSHAIVNLPEAISDTEPVRLKEFNDSILASLSASGIVIASQTEAETGTNNTKMMTPLRVSQEIAAKAGTLKSLWDFAAAGASIWDGVTNASPALLAALQYVLTNGGFIYVPPGRYLLSTQIDLSFYVNPNLADRLLSFGMKGAGRRASVFVLPTANAVGAWKILFSAGKVYWTSLWQDFGIEVQNTMSDSIIRMGIDNAAPGGGGAQRHVIMNRVDVYGISTAPVHLSNKPIVDLSWTNRPIVDECTFVGGPGGGLTEAYLSSACLDMSSAYDFRVSRSDFYHAKTGINSVGGDQETCRIFDNTVVDVGTGIRILRASTSNKTKVITAITRGATTTITSAAHGLSVDERVFLRLIVGTNELNERWFAVKSVTTDTFVIKDVWSGLDVDSTLYTAYTSGGKAYQIDASSIQPLMIMQQNHVHCNDVGLDLCGLDVGSNVHHNDIHMSGSAPTYSPGYGIWVQKSQKLMINENDIYWPGGVFTPGKSRDIMIDSNGAIGLANTIRLSYNTHYGGETGVEVTAGSTSIKVISPFITGPSYTTPFIFPNTQQCQLFWSPQAALDTWEYQTFDPGGAAEPLLVLYRNSNSPADTDLLAAIGFAGNNDAVPMAQKNYGQIMGRADDVSAGTEDGGLNFYAMLAGAQFLAGVLSGSAMNWRVPTTTMSATAIPAGGTAGSGIMLSSTANFGIFFGSNVPTLSAAKGSLYLRSDGASTTTRMYVNTDGGTTWTAVTTVA